MGKSDIFRATESRFCMEVCMEGSRGVKEIAITHSFLKMGGQNFLGKIGGGDGRPKKSGGNG